jgi:ABC-type Fe3+-hydroxamate transport system substrate-binding protein
MLMDRRTLLTGLPAALFAPRKASGATITDAAGRSVQIPPRVARVFPAGPPAAITLYTLAPDLLLGWPRANRPEECEFMLPDICARPEVGRITGRGNTANLESVLALKPDLILDIGSTSATFVSLAARVQEQTGIPYALLDGRFDATVASYRTLGELVQRKADAEKLAQYAEKTFGAIKQRIASVPTDRRPKIYYARGPGLGRASAVMESGRDRHDRPRFRRECQQRSGLGSRQRSEKRARSSFAKTAVWVDRLPAIGQPARWTVVVGEDSLSRQIPGGHPAADARFL